MNVRKLFCKVSIVSVKTEISQNFHLTFYDWGKWHSFKLIVDNLLTDLDFFSSPPHLFYHTSEYLLSLCSGLQTCSFSFFFPDDVSKFYRHKPSDILRLGDNNTVWWLANSTLQLLLESTCLAAKTIEQKQYCFIANLHTRWTCILGSQPKIQFTDVNALQFICSRLATENI